MGEHGRRDGAEDTRAQHQQTQGAAVAAHVAHHPVVADRLFRDGASGAEARRASADDPFTVARHQLQEVAVHTYDAQLALGAGKSLPDEVALDGVEEFLSTCCATTSAWPHEPAVVDVHATEGRSWEVSLSAVGARITRLPTRSTAAEAPLQGTANDLVLALYGRTPVESLKIEGDRRLLGLLRAWDPDEQGVTMCPGRRGRVSGPWESLWSWSSSATTATGRARSPSERL